METIIAVACALFVIWFCTIGLGNISSPGFSDQEVINTLQPKNTYKRKSKSQHDKNIEAAIEYHLDNNNPLPDMNDMPAFKIGAGVADWQVKNDRLGEKDYQGVIYWNGQS